MALDQCTPALLDLNMQIMPASGLPDLAPVWMFVAAAHDPRQTIDDSGCHPSFRGLMFELIYELLDIMQFCAFQRESDAPWVSGTQSRQNAALCAI
jgi:hypothetical protein